MDELDEIHASAEVALDFETDGLIPYESTPVGVSLAWRVGKEYRAKYWSLDFFPGGKNKVSWRWFNTKILTPIWNDPNRTMIMHNARYDLQVAIRRRGGYPLSVEQLYGQQPRCKVEDTMILAFLVDENLPRKLKALSRIYLKKPRATYTQVEAAIAERLRRGTQVYKAAQAQAWLIQQVFGNYYAATFGPDPDLFSGEGEEEPACLCSEQIDALGVVSENEFCAWYHDVILPLLRPQIVKAAKARHGVVSEGMVDALLPERIERAVRRGFQYYSWKHANPEENGNFERCVLTAQVRKRDAFEAWFERRIGRSILVRAQEAADDLMCEYGTEDALDTLRVYDILRGRVPAMSLEWYREVELPFCVLMTEIEVLGMSVNASRLDQMTRELAYLIDLRTADLQKYVVTHYGLQNFNPGSHEQVKHLLWGIMKLTPPRWAKKTLAGQVRTNAPVLEYLAQQGHEICTKLLALSGILVLQNTFVKTLLRLAQEDKFGRVRTSYATVGAVTGRVSSSGPNLQNIPNAFKMPKVTEAELAELYVQAHHVRLNDTDRAGGWGHNGKNGMYQMQPVRRAFHAPPGYKLIVADFSQIELRTIAQLSQDKTLRAAYDTWKCECGQTGKTAVALHTCPACGVAEGKLDVLDPEQPVKFGFCLGMDVHSLTGLHVGLFAKYGPAEGRKKAKPVNFGLCYGESVGALARDLEVSDKEAQVYHDGYFALYSGVKMYHEWVEQHFQEMGVFPYISGKRWRRFTTQRTLFLKGRLPEKHYKHTLRVLYNNLAQGSAGDIMKKGVLAFARTKQDVSELRHVQIALQVHDEVVVIVREEAVDRGIKELVPCLELTSRLCVPILADYKVCDTWDEGK